MDKTKLINTVIGLVNKIKEIESKQIFINDFKLDELKPYGNQGTVFTPTTRTSQDTYVYGILNTTTTTDAGVSYCELDNPWAARTRLPVALVVTVLDDANVPLNVLVPASTVPFDAVSVILVLEGRPYTVVVAEVYDVLTDA